jgi:hypothetical protein
MLIGMLGPIHPSLSIISWTLPFAIFLTQQSGLVSGGAVDFLWRTLVD